MTGCDKKQPSKKPTNLIIISIDTLRADHLGCYGYQRPTSPTIDEIASQGVLFEDVTAPSPWTLPSHASLLTGLYPSHNGVRLPNNRLGQHVTTLSEILRQYNFITAAVVNSHWLSETNGLSQGFSDFTYVKELNTQTRTTEITDGAIKWLSKNEDRSFFMFLHYYDVHSDYTALPKYIKQFVRPYEGHADGSTDQLIAHRNGLIQFNQADAEHLIDLYDAGILQMDDELLRLINFLKEKGLYDKSLIVITADHGEEFLEHGEVLHGRTQYQEVVKVPLIFHGPGLPKGRQFTEEASLIDVMPTILSLFDISESVDMDGIDLSKLWLQNNTNRPQRHLFIEADWNNILPNNVGDKIIDNIRSSDIKLRTMSGVSKVGNVIVDDIGRGVRYRNYKLCYSRLTEQMQFYDLKNDPDEKIDIFAKDKTLATSMFLKLEDFMKTEKKGKETGTLSQEEIDRLKSLGYIQ